MNLGNCCGCGKTFTYDKYRICKECDNKYYEIIEKYVKENGYNVETEVLNRDLGIPLKVLSIFEKNGYLQNIKDGKPKEETKMMSENRTRQVLNELQKLLTDDKNKNTEPEKPTGPRMHTNYRK